VEQEVIKVLVKHGLVQLLLCDMLAFYKSAVDIVEDGKFGRSVEIMLHNLYIGVIQIAQLMLGIKKELF